MTRRLIAGKSINLRVLKIVEVNDSYGKGNYFSVRKKIFILGSKIMRIEIVHENCFGSRDSTILIYEIYGYENDVRTKKYYLEAGYETGISFILDYKEHRNKKKMELTQEQFGEIADDVLHLNFNAVLLERGEHCGLDGWSAKIEVDSGFDHVSGKFYCPNSSYAKDLPETTKLVKFLQKVSELSGIDIFECMTIP